MRLLAIYIIVLLTQVAYGQNGTVNDRETMRSAILNSERNYAVYLPPDYHSSSRSYPVLYLLHGAGDDQTGWIQFGEVKRITDEAIRSGNATPMVIIMPDADTDRRGYYNTIRNTWRYEDFFFDELMPYVEDKYRIKSDKRYRAIAGLSMGGGGSFIYAIHRPDLFSAACPLSAYVGALTTEGGKWLLSDEEKNYPEEELQEYFNETNAHYLIENGDAEELSTVRWYIDCGDDDFLYEGNSLVHIAMTKMEIPHEYRVRDGAHSWTYWRESLPNVLAFISQGFHQY